MGQAFDRDGAVLGEAEGATKREVFDKLSERYPEAEEIHIKTLREKVQTEMQEQAAQRAQRAMATQKPSIGRIVIYNHPGSADGKYQPTQSPAIIQHVALDGSVRLFVFGPKGQHMDDGLTQGDGPCQWNWPPRV
jgi:hypothetical protein